MTEVLEADHSKLEKVIMITGKEQRNGFWLITSTCITNTVQSFT